MKRNQKLRDAARTDNLYIRIDPELKRKLRAQTALDGVTLSYWLEGVVKSYLEDQKCLQVSK